MEHRNGARAPVIPEERSLGGLLESEADADSGDERVGVSSAAAAESCRVVSASQATAAVSRCDTVCPSSSAALPVFRFQAFCAQREGTPIPRWTLSSVARIEGTLSMREERFAPLGRTVRIARFRDDRTVDIFAPLLEPALLFVDGRMVLSGAERDEVTERTTAQTWVLKSQLHYWAYGAQREGKPIPRWQLSTANWQQGTLTVKEERDAVLGRTVRVARLRNETVADLLRPLIEPVIVHVDARLVLSAMERDETSRRTTAQTWVLEAGAR